MSGIPYRERGFTNCAHCGKPMSRSTLKTNEISRRFCSYECEIGGREPIHPLKLKHLIEGPNS